MIKKKTKKRSKKKQTIPPIQGWHSSDQDEIECCRQRGAGQPCRIDAVAGTHPFYGDYRIHSDNGGSYMVEIRSLVEPINACSCPDHAVNRLGTCKHVEAVLHQVARGKKHRFQAAAVDGSPLESLAQLDAHETTPLSITFIESQLVNNTKVPANTAALMAQLREGGEGVNEKEAAALLESGSALMQQVAETLNKAALH